jgi:hypothetical protein
MRIAAPARLEGDHTGIMAKSKLDMGKAWSQATGLIGANRDTISAIAGLFFFLPSFAAGLLVPEVSTSVPVSGQGAGGDPQAAMQQALDQLLAAYGDSWAVLVAVSVAGFVGSLSLLALLTDRGHPTVGEALGTAVRSIPAYLAAQLLCALGAGLVIALPLALLAAFAPPAVVALAALALVVLVIYLAVKFSLIAPVIAIEAVRNPIAAIARSWRLTQGNSLRILGFIVLLLAVMVIIAALVQGVLMLVLAAIGGAVERIGSALVSALVSAVMTVIILVVLAAIHRQLAGGAPERLPARFE